MVHAYQPSSTGERPTALPPIFIEMKNSSSGRDKFAAIRKLIASLFFAVLMAGILTKGASAHAKLDHCNPILGTVVPTAPTQMRCWFTEEIAPHVSTLTVTNVNDARVDLGDAHVDLDDPDHRQLVASLAPLPTGVYRVAWQVVTTDDNGTSSGVWYFGIGAVTIPPSPATNSIALPDNASVEPTAEPKPEVPGQSPTANRVSASTMPSYPLPLIVFDVFAFGSAVLSAGLVYIFMRED